MSKNRILLVSHNQNKAQEIQAILAPIGYHIITLSDIDFHDEIVETGTSFEENALQKAKVFMDDYPVVLADDSGLEIEALDMKPGIYSARWLGEDTDYKIKNDKVLELMRQHPNRKAYFRSVLALIIDQEVYTFEGFLEGEIAKEARGQNGFGYDPIFYLPKKQKTLAELSSEDKNRISHRAAALKKLELFLREQD